MAIFDDVLNPKGQPPRLFDDVVPPQDAPDTSKIDLSAPVGSEGFGGGVADFLRGVGHGALTGLPQQVGQAIDFFADRPTDTGKALQDFGTANEQRFPNLKTSIIGQRDAQDVLSLRGAAGQAGENTPLSAGPGLAGAAAGAAVGSIIPGVGTLAGAAAGFAAGSIASLPIFYGSQGKQTADKVEAAQLAAGADPATAHQEARIAGHESGAIEAGGELAADMIPFAKLFHPLSKPIAGALVKSTLGGQIKRAAVSMAEMQAAEVSTEMAQQAGETQVEGAHGAGPGATLQDTASVMLPTALMTLLPGGFTIAHNMRTVANVRRALSDPQADAEQRTAAAATVFEQIKHVDPTVAQAFDTYAAEQIRQGKPVDIADDSHYVQAAAALASQGPVTQAVQPAPIIPATGPISTAAATAIDTGATEQAQAARQAEVDEAQHALDVKAAADAAKEASKPKQEDAVEPEPVAPPAEQPVNPLFPFATLGAAQQRAATLTLQTGTGHRAIPHPTVHDKYAVAPVSDEENAAIASTPSPGALAAAHAAAAAEYNARRAAAREEKANAVQEPGAGEVLQRQPDEAGTGGSERERVQPVEQGDEAAGARAEEAAPALGSGENAADDQENVARPEEGAGAVEPSRTLTTPETEVNVRETAKRGEAENATPEAQAAVPAAESLEEPPTTLTPEKGAENGENAPQSGSDQTLSGPQVGSVEHPTDVAAHEAATSPTNEKPEPTAPQALAGNYAKGHLNIGPLDVSVENPEGSTRSDKEHTPPQWSSVIQKAHYGYIRGTIGSDKDHIDAFVKPSTEATHDGPVFVIDQQGKDGAFDEHKVMLGFASQLEAVAAYKANYPKGHKVGPVTKTTMAEFNTWARDKAQTSKPFAEREAPGAAKYGEQALAPQTVEHGGEQLHVHTEWDFTPHKYEAIYKEPGGIVAISVKRADGSTVTGRRGVVYKGELTPERVQDLAHTLLTQQQAKGKERSRSQKKAPPTEPSVATPLTFSSGMTRPGDFSKTLAANHNTGIEIGELSSASIPKIAELMAKSTANLFVDTGAFSLFRANLRSKFGELFPGSSKGLDFKAIFDKYEALAREISKADEENGGAATHRVYWVMPDIVGNQGASLDLLREHAEEIKAYVGVGNPIIPLQVGKLSLAQAYDEAVQILGGRKDLIIGIPSNEKAVSDEQFREFIKARGDQIAGVHMLGAAAGKRLEARLAILRELKFDGHVSADANRLRSLMYGDTDRAAAMRALLDTSEMDRLQAQKNALADAKKLAQQQKQALRMAQADMFNALKGNERLIAAANKTPNEFEAEVIDLAGDWLNRERDGADELRNHGLTAARGQILEVAKALQADAQKQAKRVAKEQAEAAKKAPPAKKLENTGEDLRRHWESVKAELKAKNDAEGITGMNKVFANTARADTFRNLLPATATPGAQLLVDKLRDSAKTFKEWVTASDQALGRLLHAPYSRRGGEGAQIEAFIKGDAYLGENTARKFYRGIIPDATLDTDGWDSQSTSVQDRLTLLANAADEYLTHLRALADAVRGLDAAQGVADAVRALVWKPNMPADTSRWSAMNDAHLTPKGKELTDAHIIDEDIGFFRPGSYDVASVIKRESTIQGRARKEPLVHPRLDKIVRDGLPELRKGNITPKQFKDTFAFSDVGFGSWVQSKEDQQHLNAAHDAFLDLAHFLGVDPKLIGFHGKLHFTIGALGHGSKAAATFHPAHPGPSGTVQVINLTKTKGDGTVAHEWLHALDHFLRHNPDRGNGDMAMRQIVSALKTKQDFDRVRNSAIAGLRKSSWMKGSRNVSPVENAQNLIDYYVRRGTKTNYKIEADRLGEDYWGNDHELPARAWEAWVADSLGGTNNYLVNPAWVGDGMAMPPTYRGIPYPRGDERKAFGEWFKALATSLRVIDGNVTVDPQVWQASKPKTEQEFAEAIANLRADLPLMYEQMKLEDAAKVAESARAKAAAAKAQQEAAAAAQRDAEAENPPTPQIPENTTLGDDELDALFDAAAEDVRAEDGENVLAPEPGEPGLNNEATVSTPPKHVHNVAPAKGNEGQPAQASALILEAAKQGVKGIDEALTGLTKLFGGGKIQSFPGGLDEATYKEARPHFEAALKAFQAAGKSLKDLFAMLIRQFGEGVKPYAIQFAKDMKLTATLGDNPSASKKVAEWVRDQLTRGQAMNSPMLFQQANAAFGGTQAEGKYSVKDAYDAAEAGMNLWLKDNAAALNEGPKSALALLARFTNLLPTQTKRTQEMDEFQQFSTVPALAYIANWVAKIAPGETMLEPSAGIGGIAVFAHNAGANVVVNELSSRRAAVLREVLPDARVFTENAEQLNNVLPEDVKPTVVVMNPPFSSTAGRVEGSRDNMNGARHVEQALQRLEPGGRLVAIVGRGMDDSMPSMRKWWNKIKAEYTVRANVSINGTEYAKYGTTFDNNILVIDKLGPTAGAIVTGRAEAYSELPALLEGVRNDRSQPQPSARTPERPSAESDGEGAAAPALGGPEQPQRPDTGGVGIGAGAHGGNAGSGPAAGSDRGAGVPPAAGGPGRGNGAAGRPGSTGAAGGRAERPDADAGRDNGTGSDQGPVSGELTLDAAGASKRDRELTDAIFEDYTPQKARVQGAQPHPGKLVESAAMASVEPLDVTYTPNLPKESIAKGLVSAAQIEPIIYAGQAHQELLPDGSRRGYFIGDGTGVGKGREIAGIILDNQRQGRKKHVWISAKTGLLDDAKRDFSGVGGNAEHLFPVLKVDAKDAIKHKSGVAFLSYTLLASGEKKNANEKDAKVKQRVDQLIEWLGDDFDGVIAFDEAHKMGNLGGQKGSRGMKEPAKMALAGLDLQKRLPQARIVYVSATGATEVANLMYATRLGLWGANTAFATPDAFNANISAAGIASMELVARDMKAQGSYIARSLSYDGVEYERLEAPLSPLQTDIYDELAKAWQIVLKNVHAALELTNQHKDGNAKGQALGKFWGTHQRFFNQVITSMQTPAIIERAQKEIAAGNAAVFQLVNTNEATQDRLVKNAAVEGKELEELDFSPRETLIEYLRRSFPVAEYQLTKDPSTGVVKSEPVLDSAGQPVFSKAAIAARDKLIDTLREIRVPDNPIDLIIEALGDKNVAEVTGRARRFVKVTTPDGGFSVKEQKRGASANKTDAQAFQDDKRQALIFSDAGGTGFSFQSDRSAKNQRRRVHFLVQPGWIAANAVQGFGRTHRSNEVNQPFYILPQTNLKAQKRFISSIARRLDQLGALTKGQRNTGSQGLFTDRDNLESKYAQAALRALFEDMAPSGRKATGIENAAELLKAMGLEEIYDPKTGGITEGKMPGVPQFLNRLLSLTTVEQDQVFGEFEARMDAAIDGAIENGTYDDGMQTIKALAIRKQRDDTVYQDPRTKAATRYVELELTHSTTLNQWDELPDLLARYPGKGVSYHLDNVTGKPFAVVDMGSRIGGDGQVQHRGYRINVQASSLASRGVFINNLDSINKGGDWRTITRDESGAVRTAEPHERQNITRSFRYEKLPLDVAQYLWNEAYAEAPKTETSNLHLLTGVLLPVWDRIRTDSDRASAVVRTQTDAGERFIGRVLPEDDRAKILKNFGLGAVGADVPAATLMQRVLDGETAQLSNGWLLKKVRVANDDRIEVKATYLSPSEMRLLTQQGAFVERIGFQERVFVPTGNADVFERITRGANRPVVDFLSAKPQLDVAEFPPRAGMIRVSEPSTGAGNDVQELRDSFSQHFGIDFPAGSLVHADLPGSAASAVRSVAALYGKRVEFVRNTRPDLIAFNGVTLGGNTFYLNADAQKPHLQIAGHELLHHLRQEQPDLYNALRAAIRPLLNEGALAQYSARRLGAHAARHTADSIEEELIADTVGENFANPVFWNKMARANPGRFQQIAQAVLDFLRDLIGRFNGQGFLARNYLRDFNRAQQAVVAAMSAYAGRNASKFGDSLALDSKQPLLDADASLVGRATQIAGDVLLRSPRQFNPILNPFRTQYGKAQNNRYFRRVFEGAQAYIRDVSRFATDSADLAQDLLPRLGSLRDVMPSFLGGTKGVERTDAKAVAQAVFAATLGDVRPDPKDLKAGMTVKVRYGDTIGAVDIPPLTDEQLRLYGQARASIDLALDQGAVSEAIRLARGEGVEQALAEAKEDPRQGIGFLVNALRAQADMLKAVGKPSEAIRKQKLAADIADLGNTVDELKAKGYAPLMRFGKFTLDVSTMEDGKLTRQFFSMFESKAELYAREREMRALYPDAVIDIGTMNEEKWQLFQGLSLDSLAAFGQTTGLGKDALFQDFYKLAVSSRSALKRLIHRNGIAGYNEDIQRVLASFVTSQARLAAKNLHFAEMTAAAAAIPDRYGDVAADAAKLVKYVQNPTNEASALRGLLFVNFLGGSVASALTNMTQPFMMTAPYLSQFSNPVAAFKALGQAMKTSGVPADAELRDALARAAKEGVTEPQELHQLYAESIRGLGRTLVVRKGLRVWGSFFALAESFNRRVTFIAAFRMAQDGGMDAVNAAQRARGQPTFDTPFDFAEHAVEDTQGIYNRANRPNAARGALGATVFTFKQFTIAYLEFLSRLPAREKAFAAALLLLATGLQGAPGADDLEDLIDTIGQLMGFNTNSKKALREAAVQILGDSLGGLATHGISGVPGVPMDIQARMSLGNLIPGTALFKRSEVDKTQDIAEFAGPVGSVYTALSSGFTALASGKPLQAVQSAAPVAIQNAMRAVDMWTSGEYRDIKGRKVINTTPADAALKFIGIQPQDVAMASRKAQDVRQDVAMVQTVESSIADRWARGLLDNDPDAVQKAIKDLFAWNLANPASRISINPGQIRQRVQAAMMERSIRLQKSAPREIRAQVRQELQ